jgi:hypothetical protein
MSRRARPTDQLTLNVRICRDQLVPLPAPVPGGDTVTRVLQLLAGAGLVLYGVYMIATARRTSVRKGDRRVFGYPSYSVANLRLVGTGFCLIGITIAATALGSRG